MSEPLENLILELCGIKGHSRTEQKAERENKGGARGGKLQRKRCTWSRGVSREMMMKRGQKEQQWNLMNDNKHDVWKEPKGMKGYDNGYYKSEAGVSVVMSAAEREHEFKQRQKRRRRRRRVRWVVCVWLFLLKNITDEKDGVKQEKKNMVKGMNWYHIFLWLPLLFLTLCPEAGSSQGNFPRMENLAAFKPMSTSPTRSTCGLPQRSSYCQSPSSQPELLGCSQAFCVQECPYRSSTPPYAPLLLPAHRGVCVTEDNNDTRPGMQTDTRTTASLEGVSSGPSSVMFWSVQEGCLVSPPSQSLGPLGSLTLALWIKPSTPGEMMLLEKSAGGRLVFSLSVSEQAVTLRYGRSSSQPTLTVHFTTQGRLALERWTHLVLQVRPLKGMEILMGTGETAALSNVPCGCV
ncbi:hypothetical protein LDENG_00196310 [Lucifuga dentata]|nr:hypothetical protein LDENG_00196310 [Lucifuga dentata]